MSANDLDRLGLRGPCPITDEEFVLMQAESVVAVVGRTLLDKVKKEGTMDALERAEKKEYYSLDHWDKTENGVLEKRVWMNNYGEYFPEHVQKLLNEAYNAGFKDGQSTVRLAIRVAMGEV